MRNAKLVLSTAVLCLCAALRAAAQAPAAPSPLDAVPLFPTRQPAFDIPFQIDEPIPGQEPVEVQLHASDDRGANWKIAAKVAPEAGKFSYRAPQDGEYWFLVRTLNRQGRLLPEKAFSPEMRVLVDSTPPRIEAECSRGNAGELYCTWKSSDPNLQADSLELKYQGIDGGSQWQTVAVAPSTQGGDGTWTGRTTFVPGAVKWPLFVRVEVSDVAGNRAAAQVQVDAPAGAGPQSLPLSNGPGTNSSTISPFPGGPNANPATTTNPNISWQPGPPTQPSPTAPPQVLGSTSPPAPTSNNAPPVMSSSFPGRATTPPRSEAIPRVHAGPPPPTGYPYPTTETLPAPAPGESIPAPQVGDAGSPYRRTSEPRSMTTETLGPGQEEDLPAPSSSGSSSPQPAPEPRRVALEPSLNDAGPSFEGPSFGGPNEPTYAPTPAPRETQKPSVAVPTPTPATTNDWGDEPTPPGVNPRMVNSRRFELEYDVESLGSSGVAKVELWSSRDAGRTWTLAGSDPDKASPYVVQVDEEGIYGFRMVIETTNGLRSPTPEPGDLPEVWVGVDVTKPTARIVSVQQRADEAGPTLDIRWEADDRLLTSRPITLSFAETADGPWTTIVAGLANTHAYDWRFDVRTPGRLYVKLDVRDVAGNATTYVTPEPTVIERVRPQGRIRGVRPLGESARLKMPSQILPR